MPEATHAPVAAIVWEQTQLRLLDQRLLPGQEVWCHCQDAQSVVQAIRDMAVRGAPAIGIAAAYGVVLAARQCQGQADWRQQLEQAMNDLAASRPTAVNLCWAINRLRDLLVSQTESAQAVVALEEAAIAMHRDDEQGNRLMGETACDLMLASGEYPFAVLTHCNTGSLACGGYGTALGAIRSLWRRGGLTRVYADETRPWLQGSRLTAWELQREGLPVVLNADGAAAAILRRGEVKWVIVGADRITANGDVANKIGTYGLAILARHHGVRFMVVAHSATVDMATARGSEIVIEEREDTELTQVAGHSIAPAGVVTYNPVFDVTPADLVDVIVTEKGVVRQPTCEKMLALFAG
ncbi:MAG: S-methyl-5-thioribose-1-phosphate isomerase [Halomonadaceae bacterium]|nr:MAG: S-methyl-5-thioribose-1-phosphate isomerase [Halomonadaceae bacterium]